MSLLYLSSLMTYVFILVCYGTIGTVASFENIYAQSLIDNPVKECIGKKLYVKFKRRMGSNPMIFNCLTPGCNKLAGSLNSDDANYCCRSHAEGYKNCDTECMNDRWIKCKKAGCNYAIILRN